MPPVKNTTYLRKALLAWYRRSARPLPWRSPEATPYTILISEIMLQQTQAARVAELLPVFLDRYPSVQHLAKASTADVIRSWKGLGYNNRAVRLRDAARAIVSHHAGIVPRDEKSLHELPGIGPYTAAAVATFAYGARTIVLDVNVRRVYSRVMKKRRAATDIADEHSLVEFGRLILPRSRSAEWYHAVMDLGATICMARSAACGTCPLQQLCPSAHSIEKRSRQMESISVKRTTKFEPSFNGIPHRIWRGRVVSILRTSRRPLRIATVLQRLDIEKPGSAEVRWLRDLLNALQKDGIVRLKDQSVILSED